MSSSPRHGAADVQSAPSSLASSPLRSSRFRSHALGVTNQGHEPDGSVSRLCRDPHPKETLLRQELTAPDPRHLIGSLRNSVARDAVKFHVHPGVPPPLPSPTSVFTKLVARTPECNAAAPVGTVAQGIPAFLPDASTPSHVTPARTAAVKVQPIAVASYAREQGNNNVAHNSGTGGAPAATDGPTAFHRAVFHIPLADARAPPLPSALPSNTRSGNSQFHTPTWAMVQPASDAVSFSSPTSQFDRNFLGLNRSSVGQLEKVRDQVRQEVRTTVLRERDAALVASRTEEMRRQERVDEGRIRSKSQQFLEYQKRLASYKYTNKP